MTTDKENQEPLKGDSEIKEMELDGKFNDMYDTLVYCNWVDT
jgi:hypothetical protein